MSKSIRANERKSGRGNVALSVSSRALRAPRAPRIAAGGADGASGPDPLENVMGMGSRLPSGALAAAVVLALILHAGAAAAAGTAVMFGDIFQWANSVRLSVSAKLALYEVDLQKDPEPPPPEPVKDEPKDEPKPETPPPPKDAPKDEPPPPPAAAQAGAVVTQEPAKDEPVDLTGNTFVTGSGSSFAGGTTQTGGTSKTAVYNAAAVATGVAGGTGTAPAPPKVDRSRKATIANQANLSRCPFPPEADADQVDDAFVGIEVKTTPDGRAENVSVWLDPGHGFSREAKKCALREKYEPALSVDGTPMPGTYRVRFHFSR
jgi:protein TonB